MNDEEIHELLEQYGYPPHVVNRGRAGLVEAWRKFVEQVEKGYRFGLYDYRNDLDTRGVLARLGLDQEVVELDERFRHALIHTDRKIWESDIENAFWIFGYPRCSSDELLEDLRAEGLAPGQSG
ncbi:MAG TPA: hypothetical protein VLT57_15360 [Bryobacteraceae bacterium]|nr:hypothetical protein [Bryobacteraceae bacterium]